MALHAVLVTTDGTGVVTITPSPVIVQPRDTIVWFSNDGPHKGKFDNKQPTNDQVWQGNQNQPSNVLTVTETFKNPPEHFPYTSSVGTAQGHSEVIVVGP